MFKTNSAREIFYIFLWLMGIIFFYTLVHTYFLEPSSAHTTTPHAQKETKHEIHTVASQVTTAQDHANNNVVKKETKSTAQTVSTATKPVKVTTPAPALKASPTNVKKEVAKPAEKALIASVVHTPVKIINTDKERVKETKVVDPLQAETQPIQKVSTPASVQTLATSIPKAQTVTTKNTDVKAVETKVVQKVSTPVQTIATPVAPVRPVTIANATIASTSTISQTPTVPSLPTVVSPVSVTAVAQSKPAQAVEITTANMEKETSQAKQPEATKQTETSTDRDATMKILENARQQIIEKAEAARAEAMRGIGR